MKDIAIRAASGLLYVALLLVSFQNSFALCMLLFIFGCICVFELNQLLNLKHFFSFLLFISIYLIFNFWHYLSIPILTFTKAIGILLFCTCTVNFLLIYGLLETKYKPYTTFYKYAIIGFYLSAAFMYLNQIPNYTSNYTPNILLGCFILIWTNDTFAYLVGSRFGKHKLIPKISPKKTIEGFVGGMLFSCFASFLLSQFIPIINPIQWFILALIVSIFGTFGDLVESKFKRRAKVKDSGTIMPGHGGLLDRLDSIIFASPFIYLFLKVVNYVS